MQSKNAIFLKKICTGERVYIKKVPKITVSYFGTLRIVKENYPARACRAKLGVLVVYVGFTGERFSRTVV